MRIDFWLPHLKVGGGSKISLTHASLLAARGHAVRVFVPHTSWRERLFGTTWKGKFNVPFTYVREWKEASRHESDAVIADSWQVAKALLTFHSSAKRFQLIQHDERLYHGNAAEVEAVYRSPELSKIAVATWLKELFENEFTITPALVVNTVDRSEFFPDPSVRPKDGLIRILMLAHTYPWKGTKEGIAMIAKLKKIYPNLLLIGFGVRQRNAPNGFDEYHFNPSQERLRTLYASADIFLCPSWGEGFGLPSLEAMACGAALVTYDNGGSRDFALDDKTAFVAVRRDIAALTDRLGLAVRDSAKRDQIAKEGIRFVLSMPDWKMQSAKFESILSL